MVGQEIVKCQIQDLIDNNSYPRFSIITGKKGIGKKMLGKEIANRLGLPYIVWNNKIDDIRELIEIMSKQEEPAVYCIPDYEDMSIGARNSLLKVCEEPPNKSYIVITSSLKDIILPTILGRGTVLEMNNYTDEELFSIGRILSKGISDEELEIRKNYCEVPGEFALFENINTNEFSEFIEMIWNNIGRASAGNLLKTTSKIKLKDEGNGFDINLFINGISSMNKTMEDLTIRSKIYNEIINAKRSLQLKFNKQYILDNLLLNIRGIRNGTI